MNEGILSDDDIWVRGQDLYYYDDEQGRIRIGCSVAFDWDSDTTYYEWKGEKALIPGWSIPLPQWTGPENPND